MIRIVRYIRNRLRERSTLLLIGSGIGTASMLPAPWSIVSAVVHIAAALVPDGEVAQ